MTVTYGWALADIQNEVRLITGRPDASMMSNDTLNTYINKYYQYVLTKELKIFYGYTYYSFYTQPNINFYVAPQNYQTLNPSVTVDGYDMDWYLSPDTFYQDYPSQPSGKQAVATADGVNNGPYNFSVTAPVRQGSLYVSDGTQVAKSSARGNFYDPTIHPNADPDFPPPPSATLPGNVNFITGQVTGLQFTNTPAANATLTATWINYIPQRPTAILYYANYPLSNATESTLQQEWWFNVAPVPDQCYRIRLKGIQIPAALINATDIPFRQDLGPLIALGAALNIFRNFNQMDQYEQLMVEYERYKHICMTDTYEEYLYQRSVPTF